jgi:hypothetical protein
MNTKKTANVGCIVFLLGLAGCGNSGEEKSQHPLVGTWELQQTASSGPATTTMAFAADNALAFTIKSSKGGLAQKGSWSAQASELTMTFAKCLSVAADGTETPSTCQKAQSKAQYSVSGSTLTLVTTIEGTDKTSTTTLSKR